MNKLLIFEKTSSLRNGKRNAKEYPYWKDFYALANDYEIVIVNEKKSNEELISLIKWCDIWISVDSFIPHFVSFYKLKKGIVLFGKSDPSIFGYETNINVLKDDKNLRKEQFLWWEDEVYDPNVFVSPETLLKIVKKAIC